MRSDAALDEKIRLSAFPNSRLKGQANLPGHAHPGRGQYRLQSSQGGGGRQPDRRPDTPGSCRNR